jgi:hypothetical protein
LVFSAARVAARFASSAAFAAESLPSQAPAASPNTAIAAANGNRAQSNLVEVAGEVDDEQSNLVEAIVDIVDVISATLSFEAMAFRPPQSELRSH